MKALFRPWLVVVAFVSGCFAVFGQETAPAKPDGAAVIRVFPGQEKQVIKGIGFEIQSDSIGSGNHGLPEEPIAVPHDLIPSERERLAKGHGGAHRVRREAGRTRGARPGIGRGE